MQHWKVLAWMLAAVVLGLALPRVLAGDRWVGATFAPADGGLAVESVDARGPAQGRLSADAVYAAVWLAKGTARERRIALAAPADVAEALAASETGDALRFEDAHGALAIVTAALDPGSTLARTLAPFDFAADLFLALLKMLIVPLVFASIVTGVASLGDLSDLRRLGAKAFGYYVTTSLLAICTGQALVALVQPGRGADLGLTALEPGAAPDASFIDVLKRMIPENVVVAFGDNGAMLSIIFFALLFGFFVTRVEEPHKRTVQGFFEGVFQVMMRMAEGVLRLLPYGVFCLLLRVVAKTGWAVFQPLAVFMAVVLVALAIHALIVLPAIVRVVGKVSPVRWARAMTPVLLTAFSTSSSNMTLPVTMETVEKKGRVSNKITSFVLPLGATINMDGTALYECVGVIFLAQYYAGAGGFELTLGVQALVVVMALLASIGAAGIPSAGLVMMLTILATLGLPLEGAALLLAIDRPLDMLRTVVNVWSDCCGACVIARSEGELGPAHPDVGA